MGKLHEVLAVEADLKTTANKILKETENTFTKKGEHFNATRVEFQPDLENEKVPPAEVKPMVEQVKAKLEYTGAVLAKHIDNMYQKELTNTIAKADLVLDGNIVQKSVPATVLLGLESKLKEYRNMYEKIPTLAPGKEWNLDDKTGLYKTLEERIRTKKVLKNHVKAEATKDHPAQVEVFSEDTRTGLVKSWTESSAITSLEKHEMLARLDNLIRAVKQARQRANNVDALHVKLGSQLFQYVNEGKVSGVN